MLPAWTQRWDYVDNLRAGSVRDLSTEGTILLYCLIRNPRYIVTHGWEPAGRDGAARQASRTVTQTAGRARQYLYCNNIGLLI